MIILLQGNSGSGKTTTGRLLKEVLQANNKFLIHEYLEPLQEFKRQVESNFGLEYGTLDSQEGKSLELSQGYSYRQYLIDLWQFHNDRGLCVTQGFLKRKLDSLDVAIIGSVRNPKELELIISHEGHTVHPFYLEGGVKLQSDSLPTVDDAVYVPWMKEFERVRFILGQLPTN